MKLPALITTDLHLTVNPRDAYRWKLFPWLATQCKRHRVKTLLILGDLTDAKDYHSAELVNTVAENISRCAEFVDEMVILMGNHDYLKGGSPFFDFLNLHPKIRFITKPVDDTGSGKLDEVKVLYLPHSKSPVDDWAKAYMKTYEMIFMHQTVNGSIVSNGQAMTSSLPAEFGLRGAQRIYSGDIHVPQVIGDVVYVGSPYPVHFGDTFNPRCILLEKDALPRDINFYTIQRMTLDIEEVADLNEVSLYEGDQIKVRVHLGAADRVTWDQIRREVSDWAKKKEVELVSLELKAKKERKRVRVAGSSLTTLRNPINNLESFVLANDLGGDLLDTGLNIIESMKGIA